MPLANYGVLKGKAIRGGMITLLDNKGLKVDGVAFTGEQAKREGWTLVF